MQQTTNYQLSQWEKTDRIMMDDFNRDNLIIENGFQALKAALTAERQALAAETAAREAAVKAALDACPYVKLLDITTTEASPRIDVDVSHIDFTRYAKIELAPELPALDKGVSLLVNGETSYTTYDTTGSGSTHSQLEYLAIYYGYSYGTVIFHTPTPEGRVGCLCISGGSRLRSAYQHYASVRWKDLHTLSFLGEEVIPAGSRIVMFGVKK